jgi:hypothetical protein
VKVADALARFEIAGSCWNYLGALGWNGYGQAYCDGQNWRVHRLAYTVAKGPIPAGHVVMHSCDNRRCINPDHLSVGTQKQNIRDSIARRELHVARLNKDKTHCPRGHAYAQWGREVPNKGGWIQRDCIMCDRVRYRKQAGWPAELWEVSPQELGTRKSSQSQKETK